MWSENNRRTMGDEGGFGVEWKRVRMRKDERKG